MFHVLRLRLQLNFDHIKGMVTKTFKRELKISCTQKLTQIQITTS